MATGYVHSLTHIAPAIVVVFTVLFFADILVPKSEAQMVTGSRIPGYAKTFGIDREAEDFSVQQIACSVPGNVLWPGDTASFTFLVENKSEQAIKTEGKVEAIRYGTRGRPGDIWTPQMFKIADAGVVPIQVDIPARGSTKITVTLDIPDAFGGYGLVMDLGTHGRALGAAAVRTVEADPGPVQFPTFQLGSPRWHNQSNEAFAFFKRIGAKGARMEVGAYRMTGEDRKRMDEEWREHIKWLSDNNVTIMLTVGAGRLPQPLNRPRPHLDENDTMLETKSDMAWLPEYDDEFQEWITMIAGEYGWPKGPVNAMELWNEPWEGLSISGWGADMPRYREIYRHLALGIEAARKENAVEVLIGGASSSSNTLDKFFGDGSDEFLKWLDFCSIHYQPMAAIPALIPEWTNREHPNGPVRVWDTESWIANTDDRVAVVISTMRAQGQSRACGIYAGNVYEPQRVEVDGETIHVVQAWSPAAALAAAQKFIGQRDFKELLFRNGLPWVMVFDGIVKGRNEKLAAKPDDGTVVIVGDLGAVYDRNRTLFRSVMGLMNRGIAEHIGKQITALPPFAPPGLREELEKQLKSVRTLAGAKLTINNADESFTLYDFYGNPLPSKDGKIVVPLNGLGYYLRTDGSQGSFARLLEEIRGALIEGYEPVEIIAHDMTARISQNPTLRLTITNVLNRPIQGQLKVELGDLALEQAEQTLSFEPHETKEIELKVAGGEERADNTYPLSVIFDAGVDGSAPHKEGMHVNLISKRQISVDGDLNDWMDVIPQPVWAEGITPSLTEKAWLPFEEFDQQTGTGMTTAYLAYDDNYFYFAARIADNTPYEGNLRFETRDDDQYYYPEISHEVKKDGAIVQHVWPEGVRRFSYRKHPDLPSGMGTDNVQIAFNVIPLDQKPWYSHPPGTMPRFMAYWDTDYEYALNQVSEAHGGGTEIWRLKAPGVPHKHYYPRQSIAPVDGGPVKDGQLIIKREGNTRIVEAAIPWSEMPLVKQRLDNSQLIKFSFRVNDNDGPSYELAAGRSVSKDNFMAFHNDWVTSWANELAFEFER